MNYEIFDTTTDTVVASGPKMHLQDDGFLLWEDLSGELQVSSHHGPIKEIKQFLQKTSINLDIREAN